MRIACERQALNVFSGRVLIVVFRHGYQPNYKSRNKSWGYCSFTHCSLEFGSLLLFWQHTFAGLVRPPGVVKPSGNSITTLQQNDIITDIYAWV